MPDLSDTEITSDKLYLLTGQFDDKGSVTYVNESVEKRGSVTKLNLVDNNSETNKKDEDKKFQVLTLSSRRKLILALVCLSNVCAGCSYSILAPFFPQAAEKKGMPEAVTGFVFSSFELICFVSSVLYGNYLSRIGPKFLFVSGILAAGVCSILFGLLDKSPPGGTFIALSFVCRLFEATSVAAFVTSSFAIVCTEFPQSVSTVFGLTEASMSIGLMIGPAVGGVLHQVGGFGLPFFVIGALILLNGCVTILLFPPQQEIPHVRQSNMWALFRSSLVWEALHCLFLAIIGVTVFGPVLSSYLEQFHLSSALIGLMFVIVPGLYGMTTSLWGYLSDTKDLKEVLIIVGGIACGIGYLLIGPSPLLSFLQVKLWVTALGLIVFGLSYGCLLVASVKCIVIGASELGFENNLATFGLISGLFNATVYMGAFVGPSMSGGMVQALGFRWATTIISGLYFLSTLFSFLYFLHRYLRTSKKSNQREEHHESRDQNIASGHVPAIVSVTISIH